MTTATRKRAIVQPGGVIEVKSEDFPVGTTVEVIVLAAVEAPPSPLVHPLAGLSRDERIAKIRELMPWEDSDPELDEIFSNLAKERHADRGRPLIDFED